MMRTLLTSFLLNGQTKRIQERLGVSRFYSYALIFLAGGFLLINSHKAAAAIDCTLYNNVPANRFITMPILVPNITAGRDLPIGTVIYRQRYTPNFTEMVGTTCTNTVGTPFSATARIVWDVIATPSGPASASGGYSNVFPTNVPGVGVSFVHTGTHTEFTVDAFPKTRDTAMPCSGGTCEWGMPANQFNMELLLIKTGVIPLTSGNIVLASSFPTFAIDAGTVEYPPLKRFLTFGFSGQINVVAKTCTTPDVNVDLGKHVTSQFTGVGSTTTWKNFDINLIDCPAFHGSYLRNAMDMGITSNVVWSEDSGAVQVGTPTFQNLIHYTLKPLTTIISNAPGPSVIAIDSGSNAATGVGIEIASGNDGPIVFNAIVNSGMVLSTVDGASYKIPFKARYYQTDPIVTAGLANASVEFVIAYH